MGGVGEHDVALDGRQFVGDLLQKRHESEIGHDHAVLRVIDDPDDLLDEQPRIDGMIDGADAENSVPGLHVPPGVPGERRYPVAELDAVAVEPLRHAQGAGADFGVIRAVERSFDRA